MGQRKSAVVRVGMLSVLAASVVACRSQPPTHQETCVDQSRNVVDWSKCEEADKARRTPGSTYPFWLYSHYYAPYNGGGYPVGSHMTSGSYVAPSGGATRMLTGAAAYRAASPGVTRGGFGSFARGSVGA